MNALVKTCIIILLCCLLTDTGIVLSASYRTSYRGSAPVHISNVQCSGSESRLIDCPYSSGGSGSVESLKCNYNTDVGM